MTAKARLLVVQYAGDYLEAFQRRQETGTERYFGHGYVLDQLADMARRFGEAGMLCCLAGRTYRETLPTGVEVMGLDRNPQWHSRAIARHIAEYDPTHLIVHGPMPGLIRAGIADRRRVACVFADSFNSGALHRWLKYGDLAGLLNRPEVEWIANHGINACRSLERIGVSPAKVLPWDWPHPRSPNETPAKTAPPPGVPTLLYVGSIHRTKGIGDAIDAVAELKRRGRTVRLHIAGGGAVDEFKARARKHGVEDAVEFLGLVANDTVVDLMRESALVVVPSRHSFPEGLPLTIYEALRSRTPIVASDHPMFAGHLVDGQTAMVFPAGDGRALADRVAKLLDDPALYARLSEAASRTWERMQIPVKWGDLIAGWLAGGPDDDAWRAGHMLAGLRTP